MNIIKILLASALLFGVGYADGNRKLLKPESKQTKTKKPTWMTKDSFTISTIDGKEIKLLSTDKGYTFLDNKGKLTILAVWKSECKSCPKWLKDLDTLQKEFPKKLKVITLEMGNTQKKKLEKLVKEKKVDSKAMKKIISDNHKKLSSIAKKNNFSLPIVSVLSNQENLAFTLQTLHKYQFNKPRGKAKRGGGLPFTIVFGYDGQTAGITAGISKKRAYKTYIQKLIKHYDSKK